MDAQAVLNTTALFPPVAHEPVHHILSGSFRSLSLYLLAFRPTERALDLLAQVSAHGPHQYLALNAARDRAYATSWAQPPALSSWIIHRPFDHGEHWSVELLNSAAITATSSYITLPPPYTHLYSAGGPTGEVHAVREDGGFGDRLQQFLFVPEDELEKADKTRVALRYGSHAVEVSPQGKAFIPVLGTNMINMYDVNRATGHLTLLSENSSPRVGDGPRHVVVHPSGTVLYAVTEHTNFLDVYTVSSTSLKHVHSQSLLPFDASTSDSNEEHKFRGDTLRLAPATESQPAPTYIFATTRGATGATRGWLCALPLDPATGLLVPLDEHRSQFEIDRWRTPTSGGKANAIELISQPAEERQSEEGGGTGEGGIYVLLTDDDESSVAGLRVLQWTKSGGFDVIAEWPTEDAKQMEGGSHAVWLD